MTEIESLYQSLNSALDNFICKLPVFIQTNQQLKSKFLTIKSSIDGILYGNGDQLWESFNQELDKRLEEMKRINARLKHDKNYSSAESSKTQKNLKDRKNLNKQQEIDLNKTSLSSSNGSTILIKQKQQELYNLNKNYESMKSNYSIQIQKESQEIDKYKRDIEIINMQINSIMNRIMMSTRPINIPRHDMNNLQKLNPRLSNIKSNDSIFPQLNSNRQPIVNPSRVAYSAMPHSNGIENNENRYPVSEPQMNSNYHPFYRGPRNFYSKSGNNNNNNISSDDSSYDSYDTDTDNNNLSKNNNVSGNASIHDDTNNRANLIDYSSSNSKKSMINNSDLSFNENNSNIYDSSARINSMNIEPDTSSNSNQHYQKVSKIYLKQSNEMEKTDQKITEIQAALDEADDYMNEIDEIISDNFEDQKSDDDEEN